MEHTPGPWHLVGQDIRDGDEDNIVTVPYGDDPERAEANARRIVACVNGCKGINPEAVPDLVGALKEMFKASDEIAIEFIQKKRATNWGVVNQAYVAAEAAIRKANMRT